MAGGEAGRGDEKIVNGRVSWRAWSDAGFVVWLVVLWVLSSREGGGGPDLLKHQDKVLHFGYFFGGGGLLGFSLAGRMTNSAKLFWFAWLVLGAVGAIDECHQLYTPGRSGGDLLDWLADAAGAAAGLWVSLKWMRRGGFL